MGLNQLAYEIHKLAIAKGWYGIPQDENAFIERMCNNLHDEVSELHEAWRNGKLHNPCSKSIKMIALHMRPLSCLEEELADIIIKALDDSVHLGVDIQRAVDIKHAYNHSRPKRHGGKRS